MPLASARVILASAGSGKTTWIAKCVAAWPQARPACTTFTILNAEQMREKLWRQDGGPPPGARVRTWFSLLLEDFVRPYQNLAGHAERVAGVNLVPGRSGKYRDKQSPQYWFDSRGRIFNDKIAEYAIRCDRNSEGAVLRRFSQLHGHLYIDEVQDLSGYDLDLIELIIGAGIRVTMVGDPRQATFSTSQSAKNRKYRGPGIALKFEEWEKAGLCSVKHHSHSHRCCRAICELADRLYPEYQSIESRNERGTEHDGAFVVAREHVREYLAKFKPTVLCHSKVSNSLAVPSLNFGASKGLQFDRVLIQPTARIKRWLATGDLRHIDSVEAKAKLYVAATRASQSVAFLYDGRVGLGELVQRWVPA